jgi:hypothetical protein
VRAAVWIGLAALVGAGSGHTADAASAGAGRLPAAGVYAARFCSAGPAPARPGALQCSDAEAEVDAGRVRVQVHDFIYRIQFGTDELDLTLSQSLTQVDAFSAPYRWDGATLGFVDVEKGVRYEVRLGERQTRR